MRLLPALRCRNHIRSAMAAVAGGKAAIPDAISRGIDPDRCRLRASGVE
jgi:hypothetical protein